MIYHVFFNYSAMISSIFKYALVCTLLANSTAYIFASQLTQNPITNLENSILMQESQSSVLKQDMIAKQLLKDVVIKEYQMKQLESYVNKYSDLLMMQKQFWSLYEGKDLDKIEDHQIGQQTWPEMRTRKIQLIGLKHKILEFYQDFFGPNQSIQYAHPDKKISERLQNNYNNLKECSFAEKYPLAYFLLSSDSNSDVEQLLTILNDIQTGDVYSILALKLNSQMSIPWISNWEQLSPISHKIACYRIIQALEIYKKVWIGDPNLIPAEKLLSEEEKRLSAPKKEAIAHAKRKEITQEIEYINEKIDAIKKFSKQYVIRTNPIDGILSDLSSRPSFVAYQEFMRNNNIIETDTEEQFATKKAEMDELKHHIEATLIQEETEGTYMGGIDKDLLSERNFELIRTSNE